MTPITLFGCDFKQPALPGLASLVYPKPTRNTLGWMGEVTIQRQLESTGYQAVPARRGEGDLHVTDLRTGQVLRVEVKTAMQCTDRKWRFTLWVKGHTDYRHSDVVILLAVLDDFRCIPYAIPVPDLGARSQLCISSNPVSYAGWLAAYRFPALLSGVSETPLSEVVHQ